MDTTARWRDDRGGIVSGWLIQLLVLMAIIAFVGYEVVSVAVTAIGLDQTARDVAVAGADAYRVDESLDDAEAEATAEADRQGVELSSIVEENGQIIVEVTKQAPTLVIQNIGALEDLTKPSARGRSRWR